MRILRNKKGISLFFVGMVIIFLVTIVTLSMIVKQKVDSREYTLGKIQSSIINLYDSAGDEQYYVDIGVIQAQRDTFYELAKGEGNLDIGCGEYMGYKLWVNKVGKCYSQNANKKAAELIDINLMKTLLKLDLSLNFNIEVKDNQIVGVNQNDLSRKVFISQKIDGNVPDMISEENEEYYEAVKKDAGDMGTRLGNFKITKYYTALQKDFDVWRDGRSLTEARAYYVSYQTKRYNDGKLSEEDYNYRMENYEGYGWCIFGTGNLKIGFFEEVKCQGSGISNNNKLCRYTMDDDAQDDTNCEILTEEFSRGKTASTTNPTAHRTIAVDEKYSGENFYLLFDEGHSKWNGCYIGEDVGSAIKNKKIDVYVGLGKKELNAAKVPQTAIVFEGCEIS